MTEVPLALSCSPAPRAWHIYIEVVIGLLTITYRHTSLFEKEYLLIYRACYLTWYRKKGLAGRSYGMPSEFCYL